MIESHTRIIVYSVCCAISIAGAFIGLAGIRNAEDSPHLLVHSSSIQVPGKSQSNTGMRTAGPSAGLKGRALAGFGAPPQGFDIYIRP